MSLHPVLTLLRELLDLCGRSANRVLPWLFKLFSVLSRRLGLRRLQGSRKPDDKRSDCEADGVQASIYSGRAESQRAPRSTVDEHAVILACSSMPATPPRVRTHQHSRSMDSFASFPRSPTSTLFNSPGFISDTGHDGDYCYAMPLCAIGEGSIIEGALHAEPAHIGSPPAGTKPKPRKCIVPSERPRYDRNIAIKNIKGPWEFEPLSTYDVYQNQDVSMWKHYVHPEGQPYYLFKNDTHRFCYLTEADLKDNSALEEVEAFMNELETYAENFEWNGKVPVNVEVVLETQSEELTYYMVDLDQRCVFWLDKCDLSVTLGADFGLETRQQFRNALDFEFWQHIENFPSHREPYPEVLGEVMGILNYWRIDLMTSADSAAPYDDLDFHALIVSVKELQATIEAGYNPTYAVACTARLMGVVANERHTNFHGSNGARLSVWQSVRGEHPKKRSWLVKYLSPLLFYAPETHLSGLERLWIDGVIRDRRWKRYQSKLERDWESFVLTSTVLLNANVALLSTPIVLSDTGILWASPAAVASQVSIVASLASIIVGLLLVRQIRISAKDIEVTATDTIKYLDTRTHKQLGLETMAIQYSLPYALLMWGMVTFLTSIAIASFLRVHGTPNTLSQLIYAVAWLFTMPLILWTVITGWETHNNSHWTQLFSAGRWKSVIPVHWEKPSTKPWTWRVTRKPKKDLEADNAMGSDTGTVADNNPETRSIQSTTPTASESQSWRVRVRNFGPVRRLTFNSFARS